MLLSESLRIGLVEVEVEIPELGFSIAFAEITVTECETVNQFTGPPRREPPQFTRGYGLTLGRCERKAILHVAGGPRAAMAGAGRG